jgi:hypothetical protein
MIGFPQTSDQMLWESWSDALASLMACPWKLFDAQYQASLRLLETVLRSPAGEPRPTAEEATLGPEAEFRRLEKLTAERVRQGLPPPREAYRAPYRGRIDWSQMPDWARPSDPEVFEGCAHEG